MIQLKAQPRTLHPHPLQRLLHQPCLQKPAQQDAALLVKCILKFFKIHSGEPECGIPLPLHGPVDDPRQDL